MAKFITEKKKEEDQTSQKRVPVLLVFFGLLILILIAVIIITKPFENPAKKVAPVILEPVPTLVVVVPTPVVDQASKSAELVKTLKVQVLNGSRISGQADLVKKQLLSLGIKAIETGNSTNINKGNTTIVFSTSVPVAVREIISEAVKKSFAGATSLEGSDLKFDVVVTTGLQGAVTITPTP